MSIKKNVVRDCLSDMNIYDAYKNLAEVGGMKRYGVKDAAHLEKVIRKAAADLREAHSKEPINKHRSEPIPKKPNPKPASKKPLPKKKRNGKKKKRKKFEDIIFKAPPKKNPRWLRKKKGDAFYHCVPGHYGSNQ